MNKKFKLGKGSALHYMAVQYFKSTMEDLKAAGFEPWSERKDVSFDRFVEFLQSKEFEAAPNVAEEVKTFAVTPAKHDFEKAAEKRAEKEEINAILGI